MTEEITTQNPQVEPVPVVEKVTQATIPAPPQAPAPQAPPKVDRSQMSNEWKARNPE